MRIGRIESPVGPESIVSSSETGGWISARRLGFEITNFESLVSALPRLQGALLDAEPEFDEEISLLCPLANPGKILGIGHNYRAHIEEVGKTIPSEPYVFSKYSSSLCGPTDDIVLPRGLTSELDYECELAVVIGRTARNVSRDSALEFVFGYAVANDVSARDLQRTLGQISLSKGIDTFCPLGPTITVAPDGFNPQALRITSTVNGEWRQDSSTSDMVFPVADLISYLSRFVTLNPGDVILTGTPAGVGLGFSPPRFLSVGDIVECEISGLGVLRNIVI